MRSLAVGNAATLIDIQLFRRARAQHPVCVRPYMKRADSTELTGTDDLAHGADVRAEALRMAAEKLDLIFDRRLDDLFGFLQRDRHGLLDDDVLAGAGGDDRVG